jgi:Polyketide cyclase / dehydrase and lipid transport
MTKMAQEWDSTVDGRDDAVLEAVCAATPAAVWAVVADLSTHQDWGGRRQRRSFALQSLQGTGQLTAGVEFTSVGAIPMARAHWADRSVVVRAEPATLLEFHTDSAIDWARGRRTRARWEHRYEISAEGAGSRVRYRMHRAAITGAPPRMRLPLVRTLTYRVMVPFFCRRGFTNLLHDAERRANRDG